MSFDGSTTVDFGATINEVDESIDVSDSYFGSLGTVHYSEVPKSFTYARTVTAPATLQLR